jgi:cold-inducible RNA-binding protein
VDDAGLRDVFAEFNPDECMVMKDKFNGKSRGFGFVYFASDADREDAIAKLHDTELEGRRISVRVSLPRGEREPRERRGGGYGGGGRRGGGGYRGGGGGYGGGHRDRNDDRRGGYDDRRRYDDRRGGSGYDRGYDR